jgi:hypothetical protein
LWEAIRGAATNSSWITGHSEAIQLRLVLRCGFLSL